MNDLLQVFFLSMTPICELSGSIPMGIAIFHIPIWQVFIVSLLGNTVIPFFVLNFLEIITTFLSSHSNFFKKIINWFFEKTRVKHSKSFETYRDLALFIIVALPFPFAGTWTASVCAYLFQVPFKKAIFLIIIGNTIAAIIIVLATLGIININI